jgi:hypothetical protein
VQTAHIGLHVLKTVPEEAWAIRLWKCFGHITDDKDCCIWVPVYTEECCRELTIKASREY